MASTFLVSLSIGAGIWCLCASCAGALPGDDRLTFRSPAALHIDCRGPLGERIDANIDHWLLTAVDANPGILEMFRLRDRRPAPDLVPWAGEFVGKYLISAIQACRMTERPELRARVQATITELLETQADDGYLGPWPKEQRLLGHWDLWGHYHVMLALMMWHDLTGDEASMQAAGRAADLICDTYLDTGRRPLDAGSDEMNLAIIHALGHLYRVTGEERYLRMARVVEEDWESAGDYFRQGLAGVDFFRTPRPRWESLHDLQGLVELYLITGDEDYKSAFANLWISIAHHDIHPTGGFSTGERAIGNPYGLGAIETCCTTAWMAITADMLRLTGSSLAADELELSLWNSVLGSQHPSGRWWTYDTPVNGVRQASAHTIVFQARHGTPELNCCSVNAPRGIGVLSEWAAMVDDAGPIVNFYGPSDLELSLADGTRLRLTQETAYPADPNVALRLGLGAPKTFPLRLRIPGWSETATVRVNGQAQEAVTPGRFLAIDREWHDGDLVELEFDFSPRCWAGGLARSGKGAIYRGPLLLAFDQKYNPMDVADMPALDAANLKLEPVEAEARFAPMVACKAIGADGTEVMLVDFASAGAHGTHYAAWVPVVNAAPAPLWLERPRDGQTVGAGPILLEWTGYGGGGRVGRTFSVTLSEHADLSDPLVSVEDLRMPRLVPDDGLPEGGPYYWSVTATNEHGRTRSVVSPYSFTVDASVAPEEIASAPVYELGERGLMVASPLNGDGEPTIGILEAASGIEPAPDRFGNEAGAVRFGGENCALKYSIPYFPEQDYTFLAWVCPEGVPTDRLHQVFSAWAAMMDDPLRVVIDGGELFARIEAGTGYSTPGVPVENDQWYHVAAVKEGPRLSLYVDGELKQTADAPEWVATGAQNVAVGANPNYGGNECFVGSIDDFAFYVQALSAEEVAAIFRDDGP